MCRSSLSLFFFDKFCWWCQEFGANSIRMVERVQQYQRSRVALSPLESLCNFLFRTRQSDSPRSRWSMIKTTPLSCMRERGEETIVFVCQGVVRASGDSECSCPCLRGYCTHTVCLLCSKYTILTRLGRTKRVVMTRTRGNFSNTFCNNNSSVKLIS